MAKLVSYWDAANNREPVFVEFLSPATGKPFILKVKLARIDEGLLVFVDDCDFGHTCMQKDYNVWTLFGWRPWSEEPTEEERTKTRWIKR